jgi:hypothetical protein
VNYSRTGVVPDLFQGVLITTGTGLYFCTKNSVTQLMKGEFFGLTRHGKSFYVFQKMKYNGRIVQFLYQNAQLSNHKIFCKNLPRNIHQIDFIENHLYAADPSHNRLLVIDTKGKVVRQAYPLGKLKNGKKSDNYGHINSVYSDGKYIFVVAHNYTQYTNRKSELLILDKKKLKLIDTVPEIGICSHNYIKNKNQTFSCDSIPGLLRSNGKAAFSFNRFTRGLALNDEFVLVGGSMYGSRGQRIGKDAFLFLLDRKNRLLSEWCLEKIGPVYEIRLVGKDYGLSNSR